MGDFDFMDDVQTKTAFRGSKPLDLSGLPESAFPEETQAQRSYRICGVRIGEYGRVFDYLCSDVPVKLDDKVVVEVAEKGLMIGTVVKPPMTLEHPSLRLQIRSVISQATTEHLVKTEQNLFRNKEFFDRAKALVEKEGLPMHLLRVDSDLDRNKVILYFASEERIDFRALIRELAREANAKVELRQVGSRERAKDKGAIGACGEETCCSRFLTRFAPVSIKMARDQGLSLTPTKVSGNCGRLKCCLAYEHPIYTGNLKSLPQKGKCVKCKSSGKCGVVRDLDVLKMQVTVRLDDGSVGIFQASELIEESSVRPRGASAHAKEKVVATTDVELLQKQILDDSSGETDVD